MSLNLRLFGERLLIVFMAVLLGGSQRIIIIPPLKALGRCEKDLEAFLIHLL